MVAAGQLVNVFGSGLVYPFATVHFHLQVGISLAVVGLGLGVRSGTTALGTAVGGVAADRVGRKTAMVASMASSAVTLTAFAVVPAIGARLPTLGIGPSGNGLAFLLVAAASGFTVGLYAPAGQAMTADLTTSERRDEAYALLKVANNVGFGSGFVVGGLLYAVASVAVFVGDGLTSAVFALVILALVPRSTGDDTGRQVGEVSGVTKEPDDDTDTGRDATAPRGRVPDWSVPDWRGVAARVREGARAWWRAASRPRVVTLAVVNVGFAAMYAQMQTTVPVVATERLGLSSEQLGTLYVLNPVTLVVLQLPVVRWIGDWRRTRGLMLAAGFWAASMLAAWAADLGVGAVAVFGLPAVGVAFVAGHLVLRTVGEILHSPLASTLMSDLGQAGERGTQLSLLEIAKRLGMGLGSAVGGWFFDAGLSAVLWPTLVVGCVVVALGVFGLERRLSPAENGRDERPAPAD